MHLRQVSYFLRKLLCRVGAQPFVKVYYIAPPRRNRAGNGFQQRGFSAPVLAYQRYYLGARNIKGKPAQNLVFAVIYGNIAKPEIHIQQPPFPLRVRSRYKKNGAPIKESIMLTGTSPGGRITRPIVSHTITRQNPNSAEAGNRYL